MADETATEAPVEEKTEAYTPPTEEGEPKLSEEEALAKRKEAIKNMKGDLPDLRIQAEYEELITKIEAARFERIQISMHMAQMMAGPGMPGAPSAPGAGQESAPQPERKLKTD